MKRTVPAILALAAFVNAWALPNAPQAQNPMVVLDTSMGAIKVELYADKAPVSVKNFLSYVEKGHYNGTIFHRVISNFMIQGGGFEMDGKQKPVEAPIKNESSNGLRNARGTLAMARTSDPDSATAQFFINTVDNPFLDKENARDGHGYAVFGKVVEGMDVVDKIRAVKTGNNGPNANWPVEAVVIKSAKKAS
jgi:peptidyl-prolyl cis-trans isomerase A (cyclophilin A)